MADSKHTVGYLRQIQSVDELNPCPKCGRRPMFGYACGEYFIMGRHEGCPVCDNFREQEAEAWNRRADDV